MKRPENIKVITIEEYKAMRHKLYTMVCVLSKSGRNNCIYKDVDNLSRPYFETQHGHKTPHKYMIINYLNKH